MARKVRLLTTTGNGRFEEVEWLKPNIRSDQIEVKAVMTGVCRSDIDMMMGQFALPTEMHGHEGLGIVTAIGDEVDYHPLQIGSFVATRGEPAYADYYNVDDSTFVMVPELNPKYILEPIACAINVFDKMNDREPFDSKICIIGTGFLSSIVYQNAKRLKFTNIDVIGNHNKAYWLLKHGVDVKSAPTGKYNVVYDLGNNDISLTQDIYEPNSTLVMAASKHPKVATNMDYLLWNAVNIKCPSPRDINFIHTMFEAERQIKHNLIDINGFWTKGYNRDTEWQQAFEDSLNRPDGFNRAYIYWP